MKKVNIILLLIPIVTLFVSSCSSVIFEPVSEIELTDLQTGENTIIAGNSQLGDTILKAIKTKDKTDDDISNFTTYELKLKKTSQEDYYKLSFDLENQRAYVSKNDNNYMVSSGSAEKLFLDENFYYIYIDHSLYGAYLDYNENKLNPEVKYEWMYRNIEGHSEKKEGTIEGTWENEVCL